MLKINLKKLSKSKVSNFSQDGEAQFTTMKTWLLIQLTLQLHSQAILENPRDLK